MTTPITYYGGKQRLADTIISLMPAHRIYCEPFFGGGAVFFRKRKSYLETINDVNHSLVNFYEVCQTRFDELEALVSRTLHSEAMFEEAKKIYSGKVEADDIYKAWSVWMLCNNSFGGKIGGGWQFCNGAAGSHRGKVLRNRRNNFTGAIVDRLAEVQISCRDAIRVIADRDSSQTFFYLDPPYPGSDQGHYKGYTFEHFRILLDLCESMAGKFILSNFGSPLLQEYIFRNNWNVISKDMPLTISNKAYSNRKTELLIFNYDQPGKLF